MIGIYMTKRLCAQMLRTIPKAKDEQTTTQTNAHL